MNAPGHFIISSQGRKYFYDTFYLFYSRSHSSWHWAYSTSTSASLPEKLLAILVPFDGVEGPIAHFIAAKQFGLLGGIDNARDGEARQMQGVNGLHSCNETRAVIAVLIKQFYSFFKHS